MMIRDRIRGLLKQVDNEERPTPDDGQWDNVVEVHHNVNRRTVRLKILYDGKKTSVDLTGIHRVSAGPEICAESVVSEISAGDAHFRMKATEGEVFSAELSMSQNMLFIEYWMGAPK